MPFTGNVYSRFKTFINTGSVLPSDLNSIQDDFGAKITQVANEADLATLPRSATLPTTGLTEGMVVPWQTTGYSGANGQAYGVTWMMKYRSGQTYPWECVGGQDMTSWVEGNGAIGCSTPGTVGALGQLSAANVQDLPIPYTGEWRLIADIGYVENSSTTGPNFMHVMPCRIGTDTTPSALKSAVVHGNPVGAAPYGAYGAPAHKERSVICNFGTMVGLRYAASQNNANFYGILFAMRPVRVTTG